MLIMPQGLAIMLETLSFEEIQNVTKSASIAQNIHEGLTKAAQDLTPSFAWQMVEDPKRGHLIINMPNTELYTVTNTIPNTYYSLEGPQVGQLDQQYWSTLSPGKTEQFVLVEAIGGWFLFKGWDALCWTVYGNELYYGTNTGIIARAHSSKSDLGSDIPVVVEWSVSHMGDKVRVKKFTQVAPQWQIAGNLKFGWGMSTDYNPALRLSTNSIFTNADAFKWSQYKWGEWKWSSGIKYYRRHYSIRGSGKTGALTLAFYAKNVEIRLSGVNVLFDSGGIR